MVAAIARPPGIPVANEIALDCITAWLIHFWAARSSSSSNCRPPIFTHKFSYSVLLLSFKNNATSLSKKDHEESLAFSHFSPFLIDQSPFYPYS